MVLEQAAGGAQRHFSSQPLRGNGASSSGPHPSCPPFPNQRPQCCRQPRAPKHSLQGGRDIPLGPSGFPPTQRFGEAKQGRVPVGGSVGALTITRRFWRGSCGQLRQGKIQPASRGSVHLAASDLAAAAAVLTRHQVTHISARIHQLETGCRQREGSAFEIKGSCLQPSMFLVVVRGVGTAQSGAVLTKVGLLFPLSQVKSM